MGEPVTEEMLAELERCDVAHGDDVRALVAEVRRLRALDTRGYNVGFATGKHAGDAAGYARAERDVVAWLRHQAAEHERHAINAWGAGLARSSDEHGQSAARIKLDATAIEQGAHRGAAKDEAPRGGSEGA